MTTTDTTPNVERIVADSIEQALADYRTAVEECSALEAVMREGILGDGWRTGYVIGVCAGLARHDQGLQDEVLTARQHPYAATYDKADAECRWALLGRNVTDDQEYAFLRASGVLYGWKAGTTGRSDASVCPVDDARILTDHEGVHCQDHGWFCDDDCRRAVCDPPCRNIDFDTAEDFR